jgi:hypothetical protein
MTVSGLPRACFAKPEIVEVQRVWCCVTERDPFVFAAIDLNMLVPVETNL